MVFDGNQNNRETTERMRTLGWILTAVCFAAAPTLVADSAVGDAGHYLMGWPHVYLHNPDGCEIRSPARMAIWNPMNRKLKLVVGTYLPRHMFPGPDPKTGKTSPLPDAEHDQAMLRLTHAEGDLLFEDQAPLKHLHGEPGYSRIIEDLDGVGFLTVHKAEHFWLYTYPATPLVMLGQPLDEDWSRFRFDAGTARNWYFRVPKNTRSFQVRAQAEDATDVMDLAVNTPDRTIARIYANQGMATVDVPEGMDDKIWHIRIDLGSATRFDSRLPRPRFPYLNMTLDIKGVPAILAPTWEQWFNPAAPTTSTTRSDGTGATPAL